MWQIASNYLKEVRAYYFWCRDWYMGINNQESGNFAEVRYPYAQKTY